MAFLQWVQSNWFDLLQTSAIVGTFVAMRRDRTKEDVQNRLHFTLRHAQLSRRRVTDPKLWRVIKTDANLEETPVSEYEESYVREMLNNFAATFYASERGVYTQPDALADDIRSFFALPIPKAIWDKTKRFHDADFVEFVESHFPAKA